jgi:hypothetical protein
VTGYTITRLFAFEDGHTGFEDVVLVFDHVMEAPPAEPAALANIGPATSVSVMRAGRNWGGDVAHPAPARQLLTVLAGAWQVTTSGGETRRFDVGSSLLVEDLTGLGHSSLALEDDSLALVTVL